jgi:hypothetical protein
MAPQIASRTQSSSKRTGVSICADDRHGEHYYRLQGDRYLSALPMAKKQDSVKAKAIQERQEVRSAFAEIP